VFAAVRYCTWPVSYVRLVERSNFQVDLHKNCALLGYCAASSGSLLPTFRDNLFLSSVIEDGTDKLTRNVGKKYLQIVAPEDGTYRFTRNFGNK
jgi:hypothetical protein